MVRSAESNDERQIWKVEMSATGRPCQDPNGSRRAYASFSQMRQVEAAHNTLHTHTHTQVIKVPTNSSRCDCYAQSMSAL